MTWMFDQGPNVACITCRSVIAGSPILSVTHYDDDHSWAFLDGQVVGPGEALIVAMSTVIDRHPAIREVANLAPGWTAVRTAADQPWVLQQDVATGDA